MANFNRFMYRVTCLLAISVLLFVVGCSPTATKGAGALKEEAPSNKKEGTSNIKKMPDQVIKVKAAMTSGVNASYLPWIVAEKKDMFKKYNLDVEFISVDGTAGLRGLATGELQFLAGLPESTVSGIAEGANVKLIGAMMNKSISVIVTSPDIKKVEDLKGKAAAAVLPGNGTDILIRLWLKKNGLEPDKDVRILSAGGNAQRVQALKLGQAQMTLLSPPLSLTLEESGFNRLGLLRDTFPHYNHAIIAANGKLLKDSPEVARALMAATADAVNFIRKESNRKELLEIGTKALSTNEADFEKSLDFAFPAYADKGKLDAEGIKFVIDSSQQLGNLKKDISVKDVVDESYYPQ